MVEAVIFDVDGTLLDSVDLHAQAWAEMLRKYGFAVSPNEIRSHIGKGADELLPEFVPEDVLARLGDQLKKDRTELFHEKYLPQIRPFPRVPELFERLRAEGKRAVLASSCTGSELKLYKEIAGITDLLDSETSSDEADHSKPHPDIFLAALKKLGDPSRESVIVVGDTPYDAIGACRANLRPIGVLCGGTPAARLAEAGCIAVFRDPADLLSRFAESPLA